MLCSWHHFTPSVHALLVLVADCGLGSKKAQSPTPPLPAAVPLLDVCLLAHLHSPVDRSQVPMPGPPHSKFAWKYRENSE